MVFRAMEHAGVIQGENADEETKEAHDVAHGAFQNTEVAHPTETRQDKRSLKKE